MKPVNDWSRFAGAMRSLAAENAAVSPPADLESRVLREFDSAAQSSQRRALWWWPAAAAAVAVSSAALLLVHSAAIPYPQHRPLRDRPFVQIPYVAPPAPYERVAIVRRDMPIVALIAAGFEVHAPDAGAVLKADVLVGQDGRALAIRLISSSTSNEWSLQR